MEGNSSSVGRVEKMPGVEGGKKNSISDACDKSLLDILLKEGDSKRLDEKDNISDLIATFVVDYGSAKTLAAWIGIEPEGKTPITMTIRDFAKILDDVKGELVSLGAQTEWIDNVMIRVKNYVMYGAPNKTEPPKDE